MHGRGVKEESKTQALMSITHTVSGHQPVQADVLINEVCARHCARLRGVRSEQAQISLQSSLDISLILPALFPVFNLLLITLAQ